MGKHRKTYTRELKSEALRLAETSGRPVTQVERELGLSQGTIAHWRYEVRQNSAEAFPGHGHLLPCEERLRQLKRENAVLRQERNILKKLSPWSRTHYNDLPVH
jgi:transposase